jgi:hypothetical protein
VDFRPGPYGGTSTEVEQQSKFEVRECTPGDVSGPKYLHEERKIKIGKQTFRRFRECSWDEGHQHFSCVESDDKK